MTDWKNGFDELPIRRNVVAPIFCGDTNKILASLSSYQVQCDQTIGKNEPNFLEKVAQTVAKPEMAIKAKHLH